MGIDFRVNFWYQIFEVFSSIMKFRISWKKIWTKPVVSNSGRRKNSVKIQEFYFRIPNLCIVLLFVLLDSVLFCLKQTETKLSNYELSFGRNYQFYVGIRTNELRTTDRTKISDHCTDSDRYSYWILSNQSKISEQRLF